MGLSPHHNLMSSNLRNRLIIAAVGIPALLFIIYWGGFWLYAFCILVAILGSWEMAAMLLSKNIEVGKRLATLLSLVVVSIFQFQLVFNAGLFLVFFLFVLASILKLIETGIVNFTSRLAMAITTAIYPGFFISFSILIHRDFEEIGRYLLIFAFINTWMADTFAYAFGKWLGNKKLAPTISPKKTWVGFVAAFIGGAITAIAFMPLLNGSWSSGKILLISIVATFFGQIGDLVESAIKRDCGVKDSSSLLPGHGGILDRFDSLLFVLPAVYFTIKLLI